MRHTAILSMALLCLAAAISGCVAPEVTECTTNAQCQARFGLSSTCNESTGYCTAPDDTGDGPCAAIYPDDAPADSFVIGSLLSFKLQAAERSAINLAIDQINTLSGAEDPTFAVRHCDVGEGEQGRVGLEAVTDLAGTLSGQTPLIIGGYTSAEAEAAWSGMRDAVLLTPGAIADAVLALDGQSHTDDSPGGIFALSLGEKWEAGGLSIKVQQEQNRNIAVIRRTGIDTDNLYAEFAALYDPVAGNTVTEFEYSSQVDRDAQFVAVALEEWDDFDAVVFMAPGLEDNTAFLRSASNSQLFNFQAATLYLTHHAWSSRLVPEAEFQTFRDILVNVRGTRQAPTTSAQQTFESAFGNNFSQSGVSVSDSAFTAHAYDAVWMGAAAAVYALANEDGAAAALARGMRRQVGGAERVTVTSAGSWAAISTAMRAGSSINVEGASGPLDFDLTTYEQTGDIQVWRVQLTGDDAGRPDRDAVFPACQIEEQILFAPQCDN